MCTDQRKISGAAYAATYREREKAKDLSGFLLRQRDHNLRRYGMKLLDYEQLVRTQNGLCALCGKPPTSGTGKKLHVDHDHATNAIRGLLCHGCNTGLGAFCDDPSILKKAIDYLSGAGER